MKRPIFLLLIINLVIGLLTFQDYGLSWDEPLFYQYADAIPYAYSIPARLSGDFDIEQAYGPSGDHKMYGPAYLLPAEILVDLLDAALPLSRGALWHLVNFLTFQVGVLFFYALCRRWMSTWAAFGAALLFSTQPVLWGHAFINPKDMPFMVYFIAAIYLGFRMVDRLSEAAAPASVLAEPRPPRWLKARRIFQVLALTGLALSLAAILFSAQWESLLGSLVHNAYTAAPDTLLSRLFGLLASNAGDVLEEAYLNKGLILFSRLKTTLAALAGLLLVCAALLTFWLGGLQRSAAWLGERLAPLPAWPSWWVKGLSLRRLWLPVLLAGIALGLLISIRIVGPLAGLLVGLHFFLRAERRPLAGLVAYGVAALAAMFLTWPYLWDSPLQHLAEVLRHMSNNPLIVSVVFNGAEYPSNRLPGSYLPLMLAITLTLPVWPLFLGGLAAAAQRIARKDAAAPLDWRSLVPLLAWFVLMLAYVLILHPPMYDGYRHFLFILPPVFVCAGLAFDFVLARSRRTWLNALLLALVALPGILALVRLHPYPYTYYNALVGGTGGAFRRFETDYWLTCYKEVMQQVNADAPQGVTLFVQRQPEIAQEYARAGLLIEPFDPDDDQTFSGSLLLLSSRTNVDEKVHLEAPAVFTVGRDGAVFCVIKQIP